MSRTVSARPLQSAVLLAVGSELTTGETRDTNSGDIAHSLSSFGVRVEWISSLPDRLDTVVEALRGAAAKADLVVTTGGLGPTPDDLTREAIAAMLGESPAVDAELERWLRHLWDRRGLPFAETNLKQAWLIPSARPIANERGTAPGWWVDLPEGRVVVALPGPPSEMHRMWENGVLPRLQDRGLGRDHFVVTYRLAGIGESNVAALLGEPLLRAENPVVATYARVDGVDVRVSAHVEGGRSPQEIAAPAQRFVEETLARYIWGSGHDTWPEVLGRLLEPQGWTVSLVEAGTGGAALRLLGDAPWLRASRLLAGDEATPIGAAAEEAARLAGTAVGLAVRAGEKDEDTVVDVGAAGPWGTRETSQVAFLGGTEGRRRSAINAAAFLFAILREHAGAPAGLRVLADNSPGANASGHRAGAGR